MIQESVSADKPNVVSAYSRLGFTEVRLRKNIEQDSYDGPDETSVNFWRCDEMSFILPGVVSEDVISEHFDELWSAHEDDGMTADEVAAQARDASNEAVSAIDALLGIDDEEVSNG